METQVSHVSHRGSEQGCVKRTVYVKSEFNVAWINGMENPGPPQGAKVLERVQGQKEREESTELEGFPYMMSAETGSHS